jgi:hypothetical protein
MLENILDHLFFLNKTDDIHHHPLNPASSSG